MSRFPLLIALTLPLLAFTCTGQEPTPAPVAKQTATYSSDDIALEKRLAGLKEQAAQASPAAAQQLYVQYAIAGRSEIARAWAQRYLEILTEKAEQGDRQAMASLGINYLMGKDYTTQDIEKGVKWLYRAAEAGDPRAGFILGDYFAKQNNPAGSRDAYEKAYAVYSKEAENGSTEALYWQGLMQQNGLGTEKNPAEGLAKLEKAAAADHPWALNQLYRTYIYGNGTPKDKGKAISYARRAADLAEADGRMAYVVACAYLAGDGVEKDEATGETYLDKAVAANIPQAIYHKGTRLEQAGKAEEAYLLFRQGASMGHPDSLVAEGRYLLYGLGGNEKDEARGLSLLQTASDRWDSPRAPYELGVYYDSVDEPAMANMWYAIASDRGVQEAFARRGLLHLNPFSGLDWNPTRTYQWWRTGSNAGDPTCTLYIRLFLFVFTPLLLVLVFGVPMFIVHYLNKRAEKEEAADAK